MWTQLRAVTRYDSVYPKEEDSLHMRKGKRREARFSTSASGFLVSAPFIVLQPNLFHRVATPALYSPTPHPPGTPL